jgi:hypothetical protein
MCYYPGDLDIGTSIGWTIEQCGFNSQEGQKFFLFSTASRPSLWPTQLAVERMMGKVTGMEMSHFHVLSKSKMH